MIKMGIIDIGKYPDVVEEIFGDVSGTPAIKDTVKSMLLGKIAKFALDLFYIAIRLLYQIEPKAVYSAVLKITMFQFSKTKINH